VRDELDSGIALTDRQLFQAPKESFIRQSSHGGEQVFVHSLV